MNKYLIPSLLLFAASIWLLSIQTVGQAQIDLPPVAYLPMVSVAEACATTSSNSYSSGVAFQQDSDNPVRPAYNHADKNIALRGYVANTDSGLADLVDNGVGDPTQPPQFATFFSPNQVPPFSTFLKVHQWDWASSPEPGMRGGPINSPAVTALAFDLPTGTPLHVPTSGYDIGSGMEVIIIYADEDTVTLHYTREDSAAKGYTVHVDQICTDPNLLSLYNSLDQAEGPRYQYPNGSYTLPQLPAGQTFGTTSGSDMVVAIVDTGAYIDPRSCNNWWQIRPGVDGNCQR